MAGWGRDRVGEAVGVCGTDSHIVAGSFAATPGVVLGHEVCGRIVEVRAAVDHLAFMLR